MKKNLLFIQHSGKLGGAPKSLSFLLDSCSGYYNSKVIFTETGESVEKFKKQNYNVCFVPYFLPIHASELAPNTIQLFLQNLKRLLKSYFHFFSKGDLNFGNANVLYLNSFPSIFYAYIYKKINPSIKVICHVREPFNKKNPFTYILLNLYSKYIDTTIVLSNYDKEFLTKYMSNISVIPNGFSNQINLYTNDRIFKRFNNKIIAYVGRVAPENGVLEFIRYSDLFRDFVILIVGINLENPSKYEKKVIDISSNNVNVSLINFTDNLEGIFEKSTYIISPFRVPHFSRSVVEGFSYGIPALTTDIPILSEQNTEETGIRYQTIPELFEKLNKIDFDNYIKKSKSCILKFQNNYDIKIVNNLIIKKIDTL